MPRLTFALDPEESGAQPTRQPPNLAFAAAAAARASWASKERSDDLWDLDSPRDHGAIVSSIDLLADVKSTRASGEYANAASALAQTAAATGLESERSCHDIPRNSVLFRTHQAEHPVTSSLPPASATPPTADEVATMLEERRTRFGLGPGQGQGPGPALTHSLPLPTRPAHGPSRIRMLDPVRSLPADAADDPPTSGGLTLSEELVFRAGSYTSPDLPTPTPLTSSTNNSVLLPAATFSEGDVLPRPRVPSGLGDNEVVAADLSGDGDGSSGAADGGRDGCLVLPALRSLLAMQDSMPPPARLGSRAGRVPQGAAPHSPVAGLSRVAAHQRTGTAGASVHGGSVYNGSVHGASVHNGSMHNGSVHNGSVHNGSVHGNGFRHAAMIALAVSPPRRRAGGTPAEATRLSRQQGLGVKPPPLPPPSPVVPSASPLVPPLLPDDGPAGFAPGEQLEPLGRAFSCTDRPTPTLNPDRNVQAAHRPNTINGYSSEGETAKQQQQEQQRHQQHQGAAARTSGSGPAPALAFPSSPSPAAMSVVGVGKGNGGSSGGSAAAPPPSSPPPASKTSSRKARGVSKSPSAGKTVSGKALFSWTHKLGGMGMGGKWPWSQGTAAGAAPAVAVQPAGSSGGGAGAAGSGRSGATSPEVVSPVASSAAVAGSSLGDSRVGPMATVAMLGLERSASPMSAPAVPFVATSVAAGPGPGAGGGYGGNSPALQLSPTSQPYARESTPLAREGFSYARESAGLVFGRESAGAWGPMQLPPIESMRRRGGGGVGSSGNGLGVGVGVAGSPLDSPGLATRAVGVAAGAGAGAAASPRRFTSGTGSGCAGEALALTGSAVGLGMGRQARMSGVVPREEPGLAGSPMSVGLGG